MRSHQLLHTFLCVFAFAVSSAAAIGQTPAKNGAGKASEPKRPWTILVYGAVDNSANVPLINFLNQVRRAIDDDPGLDLLLFIDRSAKHPKRANYLGEDFSGTRLYRLRKDLVERLSGGAQFPEITTDKDAELNSADAANVGRFIAWGKAQSPAQRYALMIYSHANGRTMCPDDESKAEMGIPELSDKVGAKERVDFLALELCNMGGIEIAYQWRPGNGGFEAEVMVAIPNAGPPLDWDRAFARIRTPGHESSKGPSVDPKSMTAADFGRLVIEEGYRGRQAPAKSNKRALKESAGCYDMREAGGVKKAVDLLAAQLARANAKSTVLELRGREANDSIRYAPDNVDLYDLTRRISECDRLPKAARDAAKGVMSAVERFMIASFGMEGYKGFQAGKNGVYIVLPTGAPGCWKQYAWYTPTAGAGRDYGRWSFLKSGATQSDGSVENWYELLVSWFDEVSGKSDRP